MGIQINGQTDTISAFDNNFSLAGNVSIGGTLTYEDVTSVDAVGLSTFQAGIQLDDSITHLGDTDTKIRFPADDTITVETAGSERVRITSAGSVGIGTDTPGSTKLKIESGSGTRAISLNAPTNGTYITFETAGTAYADIGAEKGVVGSGSADTPVINARGSRDLAFRTNSNERLRITSDGLVGIGTDNPGSLLTLDHATNPAIQFRDSGTKVASINAEGTQTNIASFESKDLVFAASTSSAFSERLRITSAGNVAIGLTNPTRKLQLHENSSSGCFLSITNNTTGSGSGDGALIGLQDDESLLISQKESAAIFFHTSNTDAAYISSGGTLAVVGGGSVASPAISLNGSAPSGSFSVTSAGRMGLGYNSPDTMATGRLVIGNGTGTETLTIFSSSTANGNIHFADGTSGQDRYRGYISYQHSDGTNDNYMTFGTNDVERLRITSDGTIRKGNSNGTNGQQPVELFFQKRGTQIGKRIHQGSGASATTHNILNIDSWQSANSHAFIYVTVYYVSPVSNYGGRMECYATAVDSGGNVSGGQGTFATSDGGRWGNPGVPSLSWSGSTLRFTTLAHAYIDYSIDITYIAYDGAVVSFYGN